MPIFEYRCKGCGHQFETLVLAGSIPACPSCRGEELEKLISMPAVKSESTHARAMKAAKTRDSRQAGENARAQREYELHHND